MKLSAYKDLEASKRAQTLSRIILIAGAHLVIIGGAYLVTQFGSKEEDESSLAGVGTWSNQSPDAQQASVDASSPSLFDKRAGDLSGYNDGEGSPRLLAANTNASPNRNGSSSDSKERFAPRRPSDSSGSQSSSSSSFGPASPSSSSSRQDDDILQPLNSSNSSLYPARSSSQGSANLSQTIEYKVQNGDSLWGISKRFKVSVAEITAVNPGIKANAIRVGQTINVPRSSDTPIVSAPQSSSPSPSVPSNGLRYTVKSGDVLSRIASRQGVTVAELKAANGLSSDMIRVGQELIIPSKTRSTDLVSKQHRGPKVTVEAGDSLDKYAALYGVDVSEIVRLNKIEDPRLIRIGQTILIPENGSQSPVIAQPTSRQTNSNPPPRSQPTQAPQRQQTLQTLDDLAPEEESVPVLPTLDDEFDEYDLENQPLIPISE